MSSKFEKLVAKRELAKRRFQAVEAEEERIRQLPTEDLEKILEEEDD